MNKSKFYNIIYIIYYRMHNGQNITIQIPSNPLAGKVIQMPNAILRKPPMSRIKFLQTQYAMKPRTH